MKLIEIRAFDPQATPDAEGRQVAAADPVAHGLGVDLQDLGDLAHCQERFCLRIER